MTSSYAKLTIVASLLIGGCSSVYFDAMEKIGIPKRDILISRVDDAQQSQQDAKEEFSDALTKFSAILNFDGGDLQDRYEGLQGVFDDCEERAEELGDRISSVESVSDALFDEWQQELDLYSNQRLKNASASQLRQTKNQYKQLIRSMRSAEAKMPPVLNAFRDQVLFLKHNLNAQAIASIKSEYRNIQRDVNQLVAEMEKAISQSQKFIKTLQQST